MSDTNIIYRGRRVTPDWPNQIHRAQDVRSCFPVGRQMDRVPYGSERIDWGAEERACHDCAVIKGELHVPGCDVERCPWCDGQKISCPCYDFEQDERPGDGLWS